MKPLLKEINYFSSRNAFIPDNILKFTKTSLMLETWLIQWSVLQLFIRYIIFSSQRCWDIATSINNKPKYFRLQKTVSTMFWGSGYLLNRIYYFAGASEKLTLIFASNATILGGNMITNFFVNSYDTFYFWIQYKTEKSKL